MNLSLLFTSMVFFIGLNLTPPGIYIFSTQLTKKKFLIKNNDMNNKSENTEWDKELLSKGLF